MVGGPRGNDSRLHQRGVRRAGRFDRVEGRAQRIHGDETHFSDPCEPKDSSACATARAWIGAERHPRRHAPLIRGNAWWAVSWRTVRADGVALLAAADGFATAPAGDQGGTAHPHRSGPEDRLRERRSIGAWRNGGARALDYRPPEPCSLTLPTRGDAERRVRGYRALHRHEPSDLASGTLRPVRRMTRDADTARAHSCAA